MARKRVKNQFGAKQKNIPLEIPLRILKNQKNWNEVRLGTLEPGMIVARRRRRRRRRHHDDNTLLRGVKRGVQDGDVASGILPLFIKRCHYRLNPVKEVTLSSSPSIYKDTMCKQV